MSLLKTTLRCVMMTSAGNWPGTAEDMYGAVCSPAGPFPPSSILGGQGWTY